MNIFETVPEFDLDRVLGRVDTSDCSGDETETRRNRSQQKVRTNFAQMGRNERMAARGTIWKSGKSILNIFQVWTFWFVALTRGRKCRKVRIRNYIFILSLIRIFNHRLKIKEMGSVIFLQDFWWDVVKNSKFYCISINKFFKCS